MFLLSRKALSQTDTLSYCLYPFETQQCRKDCIVWWLKRMQSGFCAQLLSRVQLFVTPRTVAHQASLSMGLLHARIVAWQPCPPPGDLPNLGIELRSPALQADSLPSEPPGKPRNTGVGSLSLLQRIFLTQKSNQCLLHCRWILYQLSYQGSPQSN